MTTPSHSLVVLGTIVALAGCAVTPPTPAAQNVRIINEAQSKNCRFLDVVNTSNGNTMSKNPEQDARNRAMNRVAELGGNSLRVLTTNVQASSSGIGGIFALTGEAYSCK